MVLYLNSLTISMCREKTIQIGAHREVGGITPLREKPVGAEPVSGMKKIGAENVFWN